MKKPVTFRFDNDLLTRARHQATADNRTLTNFVETALIRVLEGSEAREGSGGAKTVQDEFGETRGTNQ